MEAILTAPWRIYLFGGLRVEQGAVQFTRFRSQKFGALLAYLALFPTRPYTREELADLLWPDAESEAGRTNLRTALFSLRRQLETPGNLAGSLILAQGRSDIGLEPQAFCTDVSAFDTALQNASDVQLCIEKKVPLWEEAAALYTGPLLPGYTETWAITERTRRYESYQRTLQRLIEYYEQKEEQEQALNFARRHAAADPLEERAGSTLIRLLMATGQIAGARRHYDEMQHRFKAELGRELSPETALLLTERSTTLSRPAQTPTPKLVLASETPAVPPPTASVIHLPLPLTRFFGREKEKTNLSAALRSPYIRLMTLTGFGGSGKTRLAIEIARQAAADFPGGVWFVPLAEIRDASRLFYVIADTMGLGSASGADQMRDQVVAALKGHDAPALLVLDNFEQIVDEGAAGVQTLLGQVPRLTCLVTSRHQLLLEGEHEFSVLPLPTPTSCSTPERLLEFASIQLFVNRTQATRPDFQLNGRNYAAVAQICARLEGIPLAIELAAAWSQTLTPTQMLERLQRRFDLLVSRRRDIPGRQATLRATIEWSYQLLSEELQVFFRQLSVFRGGWTLEAAEALTDDPGAIAYLAELEQRSLLATEESLANATMHFRMLETVREFAAEQLEMAQADHLHALRERHTRFFGDFARQAEQEFHGANAARWMDRLEKDHDNFRAVLEWSLREPSVREIGLQAASDLHRFWYIRGHLAEGKRWLKTLLDASGADVPAETRAMALSAAAGLAAAEWNNDSAEALYTEALQSYRSCSHTRGVAITLCQLGLAASARGDHAAARILYDESLGLSAEIGDEGSQAHVLKCLGSNALTHDNLEAANDYFQKSVAIYRRFGDKRGIAMVLGALTEVALTRQKDYDSALRYLMEHLSLSQELKDMVHTARALSGLGKIARFQGDYALAHSRFSESLNLFREKGYELEILLLLENFADLSAAEQQWERAVRLEAAAIAIRDHMIPGSRTGSPRPEVSELQKTMRPSLFAALWSEGYSLSMEDAILYALQQERST